MYAVGIVSHAGLFLYEALLFSTEWCVFLVLILAIYNVVLLILHHLSDALILWVLFFIGHFIVRMVYCHSHNCFSSWD